MTIQKLVGNINTFKSKEFKKERKGNGVSKDFIIEEEIGKGLGNIMNIFTKKIVLKEKRMIENCYQLFYNWKNVCREIFI